VLSHAELIARIAAGAALGGVIGYERLRHGRPAGLRTHILVAMGAATFMVVSSQFVYYQGYAKDDLVTVDTSRIAASVVSGIGFLAGGVIFREGLSVQGLNTAATLWSTAAVGSLAGFGFYAQAVVGTAAILFVHVVLRPLVGAINSRAGAGAEIPATFEIHAVCRQDVEERIRTALIAAVRRANITLHALYSDDVRDSATVEVVADVAVTGASDAPLESVVRKIGIEPGVTSVSWKQVPATAEEREMIPET
jgi:putative Mg2+ transporter-C (MgtC) family protein